MARQLLRISNNWTEVVIPADNKTYLFNSSGSSIKVIIAAEQQDTTTLDNSDFHPFTIGGTIAQMCIDNKSYGYAKAIVDDGVEVIITTDQTRIDQLDQDALKTEVNRLQVEVLKLTHRVFSNQVDQINHIGHMNLFVKQMIDSHIWLSLFLTRTTKQILALNKRLFAAEAYISQHRKEWANLQYSLQDILAVGDITQRLTDLEVELLQTSTEVNNLSSRINELVPRIEEAWADYDDLVKNHITPLREEVDTLHEDFLSLNNTITRLTDEHTPEEIEAAFQEIIRDVNSSMVLPLTGLKNFLVELCVATQDNARQDEELSTKVDYSDNVDIRPDAELATNLEPLTSGD